MKFGKLTVVITLWKILVISMAQDFHPVDHTSLLQKQNYHNGSTSRLKSQISNIKGSSDSGKGSSEFCPSLENADLLTDEEFFEHLVHPCRYDRIQRPKQYDENGNELPVDVYVRSFIYYLQNLDTHDLQFKMQTLLQMRYFDPRLMFETVAPKRKHTVMGEEDLRRKIWVPHVFFSNERDSGVLGTYGHHILTSISPNGTVIISSRLHATLFCPMDLRKFPFDSQQCRATLECWMYNASQVQLHWEEKSPLTMGPEKILTEYVLRNTSTNEDLVIADEHDLRHGSFIGNYSSITFHFKVDRQSGFYMVEYFLPSVLIVGISWVSFYLQADQTAPRAMLGATSMLSFITLSSAQNKILPKVSYIKALEIWSMACTAFIFMSLVEFAFVNVIWRRKKHVELKKVNAANILKHTLTAKDLRSALGIDTSRSVAHSQQTVPKEDELFVDKSQIDKRRSIDFGRNSDNENNFKESGNLHRSSSCTDLNAIDKNDRTFADLGLKDKSSNMPHHNDNNFDKCSGFIHHKPQSIYNKNVMLGENIFMRNDHNESAEKRMKFNTHLPRIDSDTILGQNKCHDVHNDSKANDFAALEHKRKSIMIPVILTEDDNGKYQMKMDATKAISNNHNSIEILMSDESDDSSLKSTESVKHSHRTKEARSHMNHNLIYDGWIRMTPHEISHWIDKRSRVFFPFAFAMFNVFYWTFVYLF